MRLTTRQVSNLRLNLDSIPASFIYTLHEASFFQPTSFKISALYGISSDFYMQYHSMLSTKYQMSQNWAQAAVQPDTQSYNLVIKTLAKAEGLGACVAMYLMLHDVVSFLGTMVSESSESDWNSYFCSSGMLTSNTEVFGKVHTGHMWQAGKPNLALKWTNKMERAGVEDVVVRCCNMLWQCKIGQHKHGWENQNAESFSRCNAFQVFFFIKWSWFELGFETLRWNMNTS